MRSAPVLASVVFAALALAGSARADEPDHEPIDPAALFRGATEALGADRPGEAIANLEALADRGVIDAVASFDRGLAYAARVRAGTEQPGDLGRAAHGFEEARALTRDPGLREDASSALAAVRSEVARRRSRAGDPVEIGSGVSLGRSIVGLVSEDGWALLAALMSLTLTLSILARRRAHLSRAKVAATTAGAISGALLLLSSSLAWAARDARLHLREGIVIAPSARLLDARHVVLDGVAPLAEGARARILDESGGFSRIAVGDQEGRVPSSAVLPLASR